MNKKDIKHKLKETPEVHITQLVDLIGLVGIEKEIALKRLIEKKGVIEICDELSISEGTYHRAFNIILVKMDRILNYGAEVNTSWFISNKEKQENKEIVNE